MSVFIFWMEFMSFHSLMRYRQIRSQKNSPSGKKSPAQTFRRAEWNGLVWASVSNMGYSLIRMRITLSRLLCNSSMIASSLSLSCYTSWSSL